jgi:hypothetical protein
MEEEIYGFGTEEEAKDWIANDSSAWLKAKEAKRGLLGE